MPGRFSGTGCEKYHGQNTVFFMFGEFYAIALWYDSKMSDVSKSCACGQPYSISHCLSCKKGDFVSIRRNAVRNTMHEPLTEICKDMRLAPELKPVTGENLLTGTNTSDGTRAYLF